ncbi:MAG: carbamoyl phosphate synthase large subunit, partial [Clostridia bacterium]|nr:carbamoyl phosphate synthase large subunit [Clostridia bacterium]
QEAAQSALPTKGTVLISVNDQDKPDVLAVAKAFERIGFTIMATEGTHRFLAENGISSILVKKLYEGRPNILDHIANREIQLVINTPADRRSQHDDSYIRKSAIRYKIPYITTMTAAMASVRGITAYVENGCLSGQLKSLQEYHASIEYQ